MQDFDRQMISSACASCWLTLRPTEHGVAGATWCCVALTLTECGRCTKTVAHVPV